MCKSPIFSEPLVDDECALRSRKCYSTANRWQFEWICRRTAFHLKVFSNHITNVRRLSPNLPIDVSQRIVCVERLVTWNANRSVFGIVIAWKSSWSDDCDGFFRKSTGGTNLQDFQRFDAYGGEMDHTKLKNKEKTTLVSFCLRHSIFAWNRACILLRFWLILNYAVSCAGQEKGKSVYRPPQRSLALICWPRKVGRLSYHR